MAPGALFQRLDGVGGEIVREEVEDQDHERRPGIDMHGNLQWGVTSEDFFHCLL